MSWQRTVELIKKRHKKRFGKSIKTNQIKKIWDRWMKEKILLACKGGKVEIDRYSSIEIVGKPILNDENFRGLLMRGKMLNNGRMVTAKLNPRRREIKYKIVYTNTMRDDLYLDASKGFKKEVVWTLKNTNNYFRIEA